MDMSSGDGLFGFDAEEQVEDYGGCLIGEDGCEDGYGYGVEN